MEAGNISLVFVRNQSRDRAKEGSGFGQSLFCWVPQEGLAASPGSRAVRWGSSSAGAGRHIWKQTFGLRLQPMCQVCCVSGKVCCEDHHPRDWGGESGKSQMTEKTCSGKVLCSLCACISFYLASQVHNCTGFPLIKVSFFVVVVIPRMRWRNFCLLKAFGKAVVSLPGLLAGITRRSSYLSKYTCWYLGPFEFPRLSEGFRKGPILPTLPQKVQIALFLLAAVGLPMHSLHKSGFRKFSIFLKYIINYFRNLNDTEMKNCPIEPKGNLAGEPPHLVFDILKNINILFSF